MKETEKQEFEIYAAPCNRPFVISAEQWKELKEQSQLAYEKFKKKMAEMEAKKLNIKMNIEPIDISLDTKTLKKVLKPDK